MQPEEFQENGHYNLKCMLEGTLVPSQTSFSVFIVTTVSSNTSVMRFLLILPRELNQIWENIKGAHDTLKWLLWFTTKNHLCGPL